MPGEATKLKAEVATRLGLLRPESHFETQISICAFEEVIQLTMSQTFTERRVLSALHPPHPCEGIHTLMLGNEFCHIQRKREISLLPSNLNLPK